MNLEQLAQQLIDGKISITQWEAAMRTMIRDIFRQAAIQSAGGAQNVTPSQWGYEGYLVKLQYQFLSKFAKDIQSNPQAWLNGRLGVRMNLYKEAGRGAYEQTHRKDMEKAGFERERRLLGAADHCPGCLEQAGLGWQPIGTLDPIGAEECSNNCHCEFEYDKSSGTMLFSPAQTIEMLFAPAGLPENQ